MNVICYSTNINIVVFEDDYSIFFAQRQLLMFARTRRGRFELFRLRHGPWSIRILKWTRSIFC